VDHLPCDLNEERKEVVARQQAHQLLDQLGPVQYNAVAQLLEGLAGVPLLQSLTQASVEEEGITADTNAALDRPRASLARGEGNPQEVILREFGLTR